MDPETKERVLDVEGEPVTIPAIPPPYEPDTVECFGCKDSEQFEKSLGKEPPPGVTVVLRRSNRDEYPAERWTGPSLLDDLTDDEEAVSVDG